MTTNTDTTTARAALTLSPVPTTEALLDLLLAAHQEYVWCLDAGAARVRRWPDLSDRSYTSAQWHAEIEAHRTDDERSQINNFHATRRAVEKRLG